MAQQVITNQGLIKGAVPVTYRKVTARTVNTTVAATDLLNGEITVAAGAMGGTGLVRLTGIGDWLQNTGGTAATSRWQLVFGGTTLIDSGVGGGMLMPNSATRGSWGLRAEILNLTSATQVVRFRLDLAQGANNAFSVSPSGALTTGLGSYSLVGTANIVALVEGYNTSSVDTTTAKSLVLNVINGSASASYETKLLGALVEII